MKIIIAGLGFADPKLITLEALEQALNADLIIVPRAHDGKLGFSECIIKRYLAGKKLMPIIFPMVPDETERMSIITTQLSETRAEWGQVSTIYFPVIGDAMLYSTGAYFLEAMRELVPDIEAEFIPGVSSHSLASSCGKRFLAMSDEILSIIPGTSPREKIMEILERTDAAAIYKPTALKDLREIVEQTGPYREILRVDYAGMPGLERVIRGQDALEAVKEYLSIILLWKN